MTETADSFTASEADRRDLDATADPLADSRKCRGDRHQPSGISPIADVLSLVLARRQVGPEQLLLRKQRAMHADDFRNRRLLLPKPLLSAVISGPRSDALIHAGSRSRVLGMIFKNDFHDAFGTCGPSASEGTA
jgi:hypothetical protein